PNREVKPTSADGTAVTGGRVSRCQLFIISLIRKLVRLFLCPII
ncbi:MAG: hypothetical protein ACI9XJ_002567, partial [Marivirga sp.]